MIRLIKFGSPFANVDKVTAKKRSAKHRGIIFIQNILFITTKLKHHVSNQ